VKSLLSLTTEAVDSHSSEPVLAGTA